jgi:hypothetical protein
MNDPGEQRWAGWTVEEHRAFDIGFALPRVPIRGLRRALTEDGAARHRRGHSGAPSAVRVAVPFAATTCRPRNGTRRAAGLSHRCADASFKPLGPFV